jgi:hypothetical protein
MLHFSKTAPFPCTPTPREQGKARPRNKKEQPVGLHFDFARRLPQSYILKLLDRSGLTIINASLQLKNRDHKSKEKRAAAVSLPGGIRCSW